MIAKNCEINDLYRALDMIQYKYDNNITWNRKPERKGRQFIFTLKTNSVDKPGHGLGHPDYFGGNGKQRRLRSACWHVHGDFFDALLEVNSDAVIKSAGKIIDINGGNWTDWQRGSIMFPIMASELCEC